MNYPILILSKRIKYAVDYTPSPPRPPRPPYEPIEPKKPPESFRIFMLFTIAFVIIFGAAFIRTNTEPFNTGIFGLFGALFFGFLTRQNEKENEEYPKLYLRYKNTMYEYAIKREIYMNELIEHKKEKAKYENEQFVSSLRKTMLNDSLSNFTTPTNNSKTQKNYLSGRSERTFSQYLINRFPNYIFTDLYCIPPTNYTHYFSGESCKFCGSRSVSLLAG